MADPNMIRTKRRICWKVLSVDRLMVFRPASVMALTVRNNESVKLTLRAGVEEPQKMMAEIKQVPMK